MGLEEDYAKLFSEHEALEKRGERLIPLVLAHFNAFIDRSVNPALPEGFSIAKSDHAHYGNGTFTVSTGAYQTPHGPTTEPLEIETEVMDLLRQYKEKTPWIGNIWEGFSLSR